MNKQPNVELKLPEKVEINIHVHDHRLPMNAKIDEILAFVIDNNLKQKKMNEALAKMGTEVSETKTVIASAVVLINGFKAAIDAIKAELAEQGIDNETLNNLSASLDEDTNELAAAVAANTEAEGEGEGEGEGGDETGG